MLIAAAASAVSAAASANKVPVAVGPNAAAAAAAANGGAGTAAAAAAALTRSLSQQSSTAVAAAAVAGSPPHPQVLATPNANSLCKLQAGKNCFLWVFVLCIVISFQISDIGSAFCRSAHCKEALSPAVLGEAPQQASFLQNWDFSAETIYYVGFVSFLEP